MNEYDQINSTSAFVIDNSEISCDTPQNLKGFAFNIGDLGPPIFCRKMCFRFVHKPFPDVLKCNKVGTMTA